MSIGTCIVLLILAHLLCDYPLQGDFMAKAKNHKAPMPGTPWFTILMSHAAIHASAVYLITGSVICCLVELVMHALTDYTKSSGGLTFNQDQCIHLACKAGYVVYLYSLLKATP